MTSQQKAICFPGVRVDNVRHEYQANSGNWFKVLNTTTGYVWTPISCFLASNWRGPFPTVAEAIADGKAKW